MATVLISRRGWVCLQRRNPESVSLKFNKQPHTEEKRNHLWLQVEQRNPGLSLHQLQLYGEGSSPRIPGYLHLRWPILDCDLSGHYIGTAVTSLPECSGRTSWVKSCWWPFTADILHHSVRSTAKTEKRECVIINTPAISGLCNIPEKCNTPLMSNIDLILLETPCSVVYYW